MQYLEYLQNSAHSSKLQCSCSHWRTCSTHSIRGTQWSICHDSSHISRRSFHRSRRSPKFFVRNTSTVEAKETVQTLHWVKLFVNTAVAKVIKMFSSIQSIVAKSIAVRIIDE